MITDEIADGTLVKVANKMLTEAYKLTDELCSLPNFSLDNKYILSRISACMFNMRKEDKTTESVHRLYEFYNELSLICKKLDIKSETAEKLFPILVLISGASIRIDIAGIRHHKEIK